MSAEVTKVQELLKALEAGQQDAKPSSLTQGAALQMEDLSPVMEVVTFEEEAIQLQKMLKVETVKSMLAQFIRQLSYGQQMLTMAQFEGVVGQEQTSDYVRIVVPMCFYSHLRKVSLPATLVATADGVKNDERAAKDAAKLIAAAVEFDLFRGKADFSNVGVFDGNPLQIPNLPNMLGLDPQIRQSDAQRNAQDLMFATFGSNDTVVLAGGNGSTGVMTQENVEDAAVRSQLNWGTAKKLLVDPKVGSAYNKLTIGKERIILSGGYSAPDATGSTLRRQTTSAGNIDIELSQFLRGRTQPEAVGANSPAVPTLGAPSGSSSGSALVAGTYAYYVSAVSVNGESAGTATQTVTTTGTQKVTFTITPASGAVNYFNVYRNNVGGATTQAACKFIGRIAANGSSAVTFTDLGNFRPGSVTAFLTQGDTMDIAELASYSRKRLAETDLSQTEAHFRFLTLRVMQPRKNVLLTNLTGTF